TSVRDWHLARRAAQVAEASQGRSLSLSRCGAGASAARAGGHFTDGTIGALPATMAGLAKTLFEKVWETHVVVEPPGEPALLYVDLHLVHEVTSPQAFEGLRLAGRRVRRPDLTVATMDHNVPTGPEP